MRNRFPEFVNARVTLHLPCASSLAPARRLATQLQPGRWCAALICCLTLLSGCVSHAQTAVPPASDCPAASAEPLFALPAADGSPTNSHQERKIKATLAAFIDAIPDTDPSLSRGAATTVHSMEIQYSKDGLAVLYVQVLDPQRDSVSPDDLVNISYDWHLAQGSVRVDRNGLSERGYCVHRLPTVLLFDSAGRLVNRWRGQINNATLAQAIVALLHPEETFGRRSP